ncbi:MAG: DUF4836 family protein, partial [Flavobacteriales bacterium]|nr:DUF4836 family protein [Flavobacteriales bacterium]
LKHYIGLAVVGILVYFLTGTLFSSSSEGIELIPRNTVAVGVVSVGDMIDKADIQDLLKLDLDIIEDLSDFYDDAIEDVDEPDLLASIVADPSNIGIDINQDVFIYAVIAGKRNGYETYLCVSGGVEDHDRLLDIFEEFEDFSGEFEIDEEDNYHIALTKRDRGTEVVAFAWNDDRFLFITNPDKWRWDEDEIEDMEDEVERLFNLKSKEKLTSISSFGDFYDNKTDVCAWASVEGMDEDLLDDMVDGIDDEMGFDLEVEDLQECSASLYYNFGDGNVSLKAALYASDGVQELIEEKTNISTSEFSYELTMKFDDSGDNTIHVILRSLITIADEAGLDDMGRMMYDLERMF